jgi:hypothetical protein
MGRATQGDFFMSMFNELIESAELIVALVAFVLVFLVSLQALPQMGFKGAPRWIIGVCVALLSMIGIGQLFSMPAPKDAPQSVSNSLNFLLLPYAALGLTLIVLLLIFFLSKCTYTFQKSRKRSEEPSSASRKPQSRTEMKSARKRGEFIRPGD